MSAPRFVCRRFRRAKNHDGARSTAVTQSARPLGENTFAIIIFAAVVSPVKKISFFFFFLREKLLQNRTLRTNYDDEQPSLVSGKMKNRYTCYGNVSKTRPISTSNG